MNNQLSTEVKKAEVTFNSRFNVERLVLVLKPSYRKPVYASTFSLSSISNVQQDDPNNIYQIKHERETRQLPGQT